MKCFLAVYTGTEETMYKKWGNLTEAQCKEKQKKGLAAWTKWGEVHRDAIKDIGGPLGKTLLVNEKGISNFKNNITGYTIVEAESLEAAAKMFVNHPHFTDFPGDAVEIVECVSTPQLCH